MNKENKSNERELALLLNKHQKVNQMKFIIAIMLVILIVVAVVFINSDKEPDKQQEKKQIKIEIILIFAEHFRISFLADITYKIIPR